jgi:molybdenum cofactor biosynthesis protein B
MVITCSDTRTPDSDTSGQLIQKLLKEQGHSVAAYHLVKDEPEQIKARIAEGTGNDDVQAIIINGGTGISRRIRPSRPSMGCWKNGSTVSARCFAS